MAVGAKVRESHPDRNAQFEPSTRRRMKLTTPPVSVDTKKKDWWASCASTALVHDFPHREPFPTVSTIWAATRPGTWVATTTPPHSPSPPSADGGRRWESAPTRMLKNCSSPAYAGVSNGYRSHAWKHEATGVRRRNSSQGASAIPPGTSKWNKIEHRLFCHITKNWRGKTLRSFETNLQHSNRRRPSCESQARPYPTSQDTRSRDERSLAIATTSNYEIHPRSRALCLAFEVEHIISIKTLRCE